MSYWLSFSRFIAIALSFVMMAGSALAAGSDVYGPVNLLKTMATPFGSPNPDTADASAFSTLSLAPRTGTLSLRLLPPRVYLPGRLVIGQTAEFIIKGRPGHWAALAMADKNSGAKPIHGCNLRLGADRKLVSLGQIPESGVLSLVIDTPIQGDLIGQQLYFEVALWSRPDFSDVELAVPVSSETTTPVSDGVRSNGVLVAADIEKKKGIRIVPDGMVPFQQMQRSGSLDSGRP